MKTRRMWKILVIKADGGFVGGDYDNEAVVKAITQFAEVLGLKAYTYGPSEVEVFDAAL